ncbi:hypothetical protein NGB58_24675 [Escherichia coli]|nr:hypothetical protein [Escherichia coli]
MTLAERIEQKGRMEGREEGITLGLAQGIERGKLETARNMLNAGINRKMVLELTGLSDEQLKMLKH